MFCSNCGKEIEQGCLFCSFCGKKVENSKPENTETEMTIENPIKTVDEKIAIEEAAPVAEAEPVPAQTPVITPVEARAEISFSNPVPPPPPMPGIQNAKPQKDEKPKTFFGKGAFALCLIIIGILSCSTTVFATLFFTLLGRI